MLALPSHLIKDYDVLVVGGDSCIGSALIKRLRKEKLSIAFTTRKNKENLSLDTYYLDLASLPDKIKLPIARNIFICAGLNGFQLCEKNPQLAELVNLKSTKIIAKYFLESGSRVIYLSSSAVFGSSGQFKNEADLVEPNTLYGLLKSKVENELLTISANFRCSSVAIVRLTKVFHMENELYLKWRKNSLIKKPIEAYMNLHVCPISIEYVVETLLKIKDKKENKIFHLSGKELITYYNFAKKLQDKNLIEQCNIEPISIDLNYNHLNQCVALNMISTESDLHIKPYEL